jgi:hypothetical protein
MWINQLRSSSARPRVAQPDRLEPTMRALLLCFIGLGWPLSGAAARVAADFSGATTATTESVLSIRKMPGGIVCPTLDSINAEIVRSELQPKADTVPPTTFESYSIDEARYEIWSAVGCGDHAELVIKSWRDSNGNERYSASQPGGGPLELPAATADVLDKR